MKAYSKEFYDAMEFFDGVVTKQAPGCYCIDKPKNKNDLPGGEWYNHGPTNNAFHVFLYGIEYARACLKNNYPTV